MKPELHHLPVYRRQFFVKKEFQWKFILLYLCALLLIAGAAAGGLWFGFTRTLELYLYSSHIKIERTGDIIKDVLLSTNLVAMMTILLVVIVLSLIVIHRLNLHFYRICSSLGAMSQGDFRAARQPASSLNEISHLIGIVEDVKEQYRQRMNRIAECIDRIETACGDTIDRPELAASARRLQDELGQVQVQDLDR